jgi:serine protease Do
VHGIRGKEESFMRRIRVAKRVGSRFTGRARTLATVGLATGALWLVPQVGSRGQAAPAAVTPKMQAPPEARALSKAFSGVAKALRPSVVRLDVEAENPRVATNRERRNDPRFRGEPDLREFFERFFDFEGSPQPGPGRGTGSGFLLDTQGNIVTNSHVVSGAAKLTVVFSDGSELPARLIGKDDLTDVAVVRLEKAPPSLVAARLGNSDQVEIGEWVLAVGSPLAMDQTVTAGIISSKGRLGKNPSMRMSGQKVREYIQTDAKINPGNSGGPLVNLEGEVIGVNTLINTGPGGAYGFAIPINQVRSVAETLIKDGRMRYSYLGIHMDQLSADSSARDRLPASAPKEAVLVARVNMPSPAAKAGLRAGDVITRIDDHKVENPVDISDYVTSKPIGSRVTLALLRDGKPLTMQVTLEEFPDESRVASAPGGDVQKEGIGVQLQDLTPDIGRFLNLPQNTKGAIVTEVLPGSRADKAGLRAHDVIIEVNRRAVDSASDAVSALRGNPGAAQLLKIRRGDATRIVTVPAP